MANNIASKTSTKDPGSFNDITIGIILFLVSVAIFGGWLACDAATIGLRFVGVICIILAGAMFVGGLKEHSASKPKQAGLITVWGRPKGNQYVVTGVVVVLPFFPFYIDTVVVDIEDKDHVFKEEDFVFQTQDDVQMKIEISVSGCPDIHDLIDYIQAGTDFEQSIERFREVFAVEMQKLANGKKCLEIKRESKILSESLLTNLQGKMQAEADKTESASIGFRIKTVQIVPIIPPELEKRLNNVVEERFEAMAESLDYDTVTEAAKKMQLEVAAQYSPGLNTLTPLEKSRILLQLINDGKIQNLDWYIKRIEDLKLIKQQRSSAVRNTGGGKNVTLVNPNT